MKCFVYSKLNYLLLRSFIFGFKNKITIYDYLDICSLCISKKVFDIHKTNLIYILLAKVAEYVLRIFLKTQQTDF